MPLNHFNLIKQTAVNHLGFTCVASQIAFDVGCLHDLLSVNPSKIAGMNEVYAYIVGVASV